MEDTEEKLLLFALKVHLDLLMNVSTPQIIILPIRVENFFHCGLGRQFPTITWIRSFGFDSGAQVHQSLLDSTIHKELFFLNAFKARTDIRPTPFVGSEAHLAQREAHADPADHDDPLSINFSEVGKLARESFRGRVMGLRSQNLEFEVWKAVVGALISRNPLKTNLRCAAQFGLGANAPGAS